MNIFAVEQALAMVVNEDTDDYDDSDCSNRDSPSWSSEISATCVIAAYITKADHDRFV